MRCIIRSGLDGHDDDVCDGDDHVGDGWEDDDDYAQDCEGGFEIFRNGDYFEGINLLPIPTSNIE